MKVRKGSGLDFQHGDMSKIKALTPSSITIPNSSFLIGANGASPSVFSGISVGYSITIKIEMASEALYQLCYARNGDLGQGVIPEFPMLRG